MAIEQKEAQHQIQSSVFGEFSHIHDTAAVLRVIGPHIAEVLLRRPQIGADLRHVGVRRRMQAVVSDARQTEWDRGHSCPP